jgi:hypothetical protein
MANSSQKMYKIDFCFSPKVTYPDDDPWCIFKKSPLLSYGTDFGLLPTDHMTKLGWQCFLKTMIMI